MNNIQSRNNVKIIGEGKKTIMLGHGFGCDQKIWDFLIPYLKKDYRIVLFDYVGSGKSDVAAYNEERYTNLEGYSKDIMEILNELNIGPVIFVGHSVSGMISLLAAIDKPQYFETLIMICPSSRYLNDKPDYVGGFDDSDVKELLKMMEMNFVGWATMNATALMNVPEQPMLAEKLKETFCKENSFIMRNFAKATFLSDHRCDLPKLIVPSLIIQCSEDSVVPIEAANYLHKNLKNNILRVMDTKGHYPNISSPRETADIILQYLS
jgi:Predicted hydrolases or acyltransferases (alpha/beta hydrolase superfamily)